MKANSVSLDASLSNFGDDRMAAATVLSKFIEINKGRVSRLSVDRYPQEEPLLPEIELLRNQVESRLPKRRGFFQESAVILDLDPESVQIFCDWAYWCIEAVVEGDEGRMFALTDGGEYAEYVLPSDQAIFLIQNLKTSNLRFPNSWWS